MAAVTFSLTAVVQDTVQVTDLAQQQAQANVTPVNANQAQGAPAPADTVTLTNQAAEGQQTRQDGNRQHFDRAAFLGAAGAYFGGNARQNQQPQAPALPVALQQPDTQNAPAANGNNGANAPANAANTAANSPANAAADAANAGTNATAGAAAADPAAGGNFATPQQQLQQLDQTLQQMGINPQSIPLFNRMAMLLYANDPAALQLLVQALQNVAQQATTGQAGTGGAATANQGATTVLLPAATPAAQGPTTEQGAAGATAPQTQNQGANAPAQATPQIEVLAAQINFTDVQATLAPAQGTVNQTGNATTAQPAQGGAATVQIQELQVAFQATEVQQGPLQLNGSTASPGASLNVTA